MECPEVWGSLMLSSHLQDTHISIPAFTARSPRTKHDQKSYNKFNTPSPPKVAHRVQPQYLHVCNVWYSPLLVALHEGLLANLHEEEWSSTERKITRVKLKEY